MFYDQELNLFDTKIAIVLLNSLQFWQKLNVTSFLTSGIIGENPSLLGGAYEDNSGYNYLPLNRQPVIILEADLQNLKKIHRRIINKSLKSSIYINDMFSSGHDEANRKTVKKYQSEELPLVGLAIREKKSIVDKLIKGSKLHS